MSEHVQHNNATNRERTRAKADERSISFLHTSRNIFFVKGVHDEPERRQLRSKRFIISELLDLTVNRSDNGAV